MAARNCTRYAAQPFAYLQIREGAADADVFFETFFETVFIRCFAKWDGDWRAMFASATDAEAFIGDLRNHPWPLFKAIAYFCGHGSLDMQPINALIADDLESWEPWGKPFETHQLQ